MSEATNVLAGTVTTTLLSSALNYMTPERRAAFAGAARRTAYRRPATSALAAAVVSFLAVRAVRAALAAQQAPEPLKNGAANGSHPAPKRWRTGAPYAAY